jgi:hypothetical protein
MFDKSWVFARGGRPVIYQSDEEFWDLPENLRWRHVRYEPESEPANDFTWEREWRIRCNELRFSPAIGVIVVPSAKWARELRRSHETDQNILIDQYAVVLDDRQIAEMFRDSFDWHVVPLSKDELSR